MSRQRTTFGKLQRERDKQAKAQAKRERRLAAGEAGAEEGDRPTSTEPETSQEAVLELIAQLHQRFENAEIGLEDFEEQKAALMSRLPID